MRWKVVQTLINCPIFKYENFPHLMKKMLSSYQRITHCDKPGYIYMWALYQIHQCMSSFYCGAYICDLPVWDHYEVILIVQGPNNPGLILILQNSWWFWIYYVMKYPVYTWNKVITWHAVQEISFSRLPDTHEP